MGWASRQRMMIGIVNRSFDAAQVILGGVSYTGLLRKNSAIQYGGEVVVVDAILENMPSDPFGQLKHGDFLSVGGENYKVEYDPMKYGDGEFCKVPLSGPLTAPIPALRTGEGGRIIPLP